MSSHVLHTESLGLRVLQDGNGPDVLLIGGLADDSSVWDEQVAGLADHVRLTRYDGRGTPRGPSPRGPYTQASLVADALAVLDACEIERAHIVGAGLGGVVARRLAIDHPEHVASVTLSASWARPDRALRARYAGWRWTAERASSIGELLEAIYSSTYGAAAWNSGAVDRRIAAAESAELREDDSSWARTREAFLWTARAAVQPDPHDAIATIEVPALVVAGAHDPVVGAHHARRLATLLRNGRLKVLADAAHRPHEEQAPAFNALLTAFLVDAPARAALSV